jgi:hypothetical protein
MNCKLLIMFEPKFYASITPRPGAGEVDYSEVQSVVITTFVGHLVLTSVIRHFSRLQSATFSWVYAVTWSSLIHSATAFAFTISTLNDCKHTVDSRLFCMENPTKNQMLTLSFFLGYMLSETLILLFAGGNSGEARIALCRRFVLVAGCSGALIIRQFVATFAYLSIL